MIAQGEEPLPMFGNKAKLSSRGTALEWAGKHMKIKAYDNAVAHENVR